MKAYKILQFYMESEPASSLGRGKDYPHVDNLARPVGKLSTFLQD